MQETFSKVKHIIVLYTEYKYAHGKLSKTGNVVLFLIVCTFLNLLKIYLKSGIYALINIVI